MKLLTILSASALLSCTACAEFIEYPLEKEKVSLFAPMDKLMTPDTVITFWWDTHEDAKAYRLQIVSPDFDHIQGNIIDTLVTGDKATLELQPGAYTWRVRPENNGSSGIYMYRTLDISRD